MWLSYHLFCHDTSKHSELIEKASLFLEELIDSGKINKWFFIRYWIGSPHIRIRVETNNSFNLNDKTDLFSFLVNLNQENKNIQLDRNVYYSINKPGLNETTIKESDFPWFLSGMVKEIDYDPEVSRYGGEGMISSSETGFYLSSKLTLNFLKLSITQKILISASIMNLILDKIIGSNYCPNPLKDASLIWKKTFSLTEDIENSNNISRIVNSDLLKKINPIIKNYQEIDTYILLLKNIKDQLRNDDYFKSILFSHFHMFNNRLGISPALEMLIFSSLSKDKVTIL